MDIGEGLYIRTPTNRIRREVVKRLEAAGFTCALPVYGHPYIRLRGKPKIFQGTYSNTAYPYPTCEVVGVEQPKRSAIDELYETVGDTWSDYTQPLIDYNRAQQGRRVEVGEIRCSATCPRYYMWDHPLSE